MTSYLISLEYQTARKEVTYQPDTDMDGKTTAFTGAKGFLVSSRIG